MRAVLRVYPAMFGATWSGQVISDGVQHAGIVGCDSQQDVIDTAYELLPASDFDIQFFDTHEAGYLPPA